MTTMLPSIQSVLDSRSDLTDEQKSTIHSALIEREDQMADLLRTGAVQFGLYPQIVAAVLTDIGVGTEPSDEEKALIRANYVTLMQQLQAQQQQPPDQQN